MKPTPDLIARSSTHVQRLAKQAKQAKRLKERREWWAKHGTSLQKKSS